MSQERIKRASGQLTYRLIPVGKEEKPLIPGTRAPGSLTNRPIPVGGRKLIKADHY